MLAKPDHLIGLILQRLADEINPAKDCTNARNHLTNIKRFRDIIIRPKLHAKYLVQHVRLRSDHDDGYLGVHRQLPTHIKTAHIRQHQIQQDQIRLRIPKQIQPLFSRSCFLDLKSFLT
ncbi:hypothetical protein D3C74_383660 [compost metagenome]